MRCFSKKEKIYFRLKGRPKYEKPVRDRPIERPIQRRIGRINRRAFVHFLFAATSTYRRKSPPRLTRRPRLSKKRRRCPSL